MAQVLQKSIGKEACSMKILIAYDGSPGSEAAVDEILCRPWPAGSEVRLVTVVEPATAMVATNGVEVYGPIAEKLRAAMRQACYGRLQTVLEKFKVRPDLNVTYELREPGVKHALLEAIREWEADLVVAGSQGSTAMGRLFLGSVCHALVTHAPCNVEIVRPPRAS
jgi:nucleotide-binding universal stress UspA family protein